jgi:hypothetical protein
MSYASNFGQSYIILCIPASIFVFLRIRDSGWGYWLFCLLACGSVISLLSLKMFVYSWYSFLFSFPFFVVLALFIDHVGKLLSKFNGRYGWMCGVVWCCFMTLLNASTLNNYYKDGNRYDRRFVCKYIQDHFQAGDQVFSPFTAEVVNTYIPTDILPERNTHRYFTNLFNEISKDKDKPNPSRFWIILTRGNYISLSDYDKKTRNWIDKNCHHEGSFGKFHYGDTKFLEVFLYSPKSPPTSTLDFEQ